MTAVTDTTYYDPVTMTYKPLDITSTSGIPVDTVFQTPPCPTFNNSIAADGTDPYFAMGYCPTGSTTTCTTGTTSTAGTTDTSGTVALTTQSEFDQLTKTAQDVVTENETNILKTMRENETAEKMAEDPKVEDAANTIIDNSTSSRFSFKSFLGRSTHESEEAYNKLTADQQKAVRKRVESETNMSITDNLKKTQGKEGLGLLGGLKSFLNMKPNVEHKTTEEE